MSGIAALVNLNITASAEVGNGPCIIALVENDKSPMRTQRIDSFGSGTPGAGAAKRLCLVFRSNRRLPENSSNKVCR